MFLRLDEKDVIAKCEKAKIAISTIEDLPKGGVRLVCTTSEDAYEARKVFDRHIVTGKPQRTPLYVPDGKWR
ncbi:hypothetical protein [Croceicoccus pelagius]|uniref:Uncharacterized protein n=1 Tax=Croceicoccus pelagius TaxID=1703341 RepID=A0A916YCK5_9SPHN|nr:hypothetical protein [Croceicoccus pelagius]GGD40166.1 hypothetical protein GCM10010989_12940 [Croceicoccus pelagius]